ncbi:YfaZ family outer membrane protein [Echinimonas agarilytica]|uniref:YfaZ family protein n=1 Tax=Echinimonas agarilytica TaxID=1215918 RepID=A0AA41W9C6_9GAMM|nr:YfaZ family outer membrane protein [Echinimonas agarilytica]MCM2681017.1 YfaZ family protein [Echinimonas agarilytica]
MLKTCLLTASSLAIVLPSVHASELNLELNNDTVTIGFDSKIAPAAEFFTEYSYSTDHGNLLEGGVRAVNVGDIHNFSVGAKAVGLFADKGFDDGYVFAVGGEYGIEIAPQVSLSASAYYSPNVLTSSKLDGYYDWDAKVSYQLMPNLDVSLGYSVVRFDYKRDHHMKFDNSIYVGANYQF